MIGINGLETRFVELEWDYLRPVQVDNLNCARYLAGGPQASFYQD